MLEYTGHKLARMPDGKTLVEWLRPTVEDECHYYGVPKPTDEQIAVVARSLRMHHLMTHAAEYDYSELHTPGKKTDFYPIQSSIGRFLRDAPLETLDKINLGERHDSTTK